MSVRDIIERIDKIDVLKSLKYCFVDVDKKPYKDVSTLAKPNATEDFVSFEEIKRNESCIERFKGLGISIQASRIFAIDVDSCFSVPNDIESGDDRAREILRMFEGIGYCEFSFSGTGLRIILDSYVISNYSDSFYIKNEKNKIEFYQPSNSYRYVTITGNVIHNIDKFDKSKTFSKVMLFLNKYMERTLTMVKSNTEVTETRTFDELMKRTKALYRKNMSFQNLWFSHAPGSGADESERDYRLIACLYEEITQDKELLRRIFEQSDFFKTKDYRHNYKWTYNNYRYYSYQYDQVKRNHV